MFTRRSLAGTAAALGLAAILFTPISATAHCDGMDGPVVLAARDALTRGDVLPVLVWVQKNDEAEIRQSFHRTLAVRKLGAEARELADRYFFETLVRVHRAGEGAPYTGLKPAGRDLGPAIPLADQALKTGKVDPLVKLVTDESREGLVERFEHVRKARNDAKAGVEAGREHVHAYVTFIHYVERLYEAAHQPPSGHFSEASQAMEKHAH